MLQSKRDESIIRFAAEKVMGWQWIDGCTATPDLFANMLPAHWENEHGIAYYPGDWNPLELWCDAGMLWEKARNVSLAHVLGGGWIANARGVHATSVDSGPCAIAEAIVKAFGWEEEKNG